MKLAAVLAALVTTTACQSGEPAFRIRADLEAPLNSDSGWAGAVNEGVTVLADHPFRVRMEALPNQVSPSSYILQARRNGGPWELVEAHDFPHPQRELDIRLESGLPVGWIQPVGQEGHLSIEQTGDHHVLIASAQGQDMVALYDAPWPVAALALRFMLPEDAGQGFDVLLGHTQPDTNVRVRFDTAGRIAVIQSAGDEDRLLADQPASLARGVWHVVEIEVEDGKLGVDFADGSLEISVPIAVIDISAPPAIAVPANSSVNVSDISLEGIARTPLVSIVATPAYSNGDATSDLLSGSPAPFTPGLGVSLAERVLAVNDEETHSEFEWPLVIRRFADGPSVNETGDVFEFRIVDRTGEDAISSAIARVTLDVPPRHLGGTFVETPGRIGPWQAENGNLYFIMEPTETDNKFMMMKSVDGGRSWLEVDGAHRPQTGDLESVDARMIDGRIHIIHQVTQSVRYHVFRTSDHPAHPDSWELVDEVAAREQTIAQASTAVVRPDGSILAVFLSDRLHYSVRSPDGLWSTPEEIDPEASFINTGPQAAVGSDGTVHLAYSSDEGSIWYRRLLADGTLTARQLVATGAGRGKADYGSVLPLAHDAQSGTTFIVYRLADGSLWESHAQGEGAPSAPVLVTPGPVITDAVDSQQPAADLVVFGGVPHVLFVDEATRSIYSTRRDGAAWQEPVLRIDGIKGSWVRGNSLNAPDGRPVYAYVFDAGSEGGSGLNRYAAIPLDAQ